MERWRLRGLWQNQDFARLWMGQTVSRFGTYLTWSAVSALAVLTLRATPGQMGALEATGGGAILVFGLLAGVWVDRLRRRPLMIAADIARALLLLSIPIAVWRGSLSLTQLFVVAALVGTLRVFFDTADIAYLPVLLEEDALVEGNSKISASGSVAEIGGPSLGGVLVQMFSAPIAIVLDALSYLFSALCLGAIRKPEPPPPPSEHRQSTLREAREGLAIVTQSPILRALAGRDAAGTFFGNFYAALYYLYLIRGLGLTPAFVGVSISAGGVGALLGAFLVGPAQKRYGIGTILLGCQVFGLGTSLMIPLAQGPRPLVMALIVAAQFFGDTASTIFGIVDQSVRQAMIPVRLLGRANASLNFLTRGLAPLGAITGGLLGAAIGMRQTLLLSLIGGVIALLILTRSPLRRLRSLPRLAA